MTDILVELIKDKVSFSLSLSLPPPSLLRSRNQMEYQWLDGVAYLEIINHHSTRFSGLCHTINNFYYHGYNISHNFASNLAMSRRRLDRAVTDRKIDDCYFFVILIPDKVYVFVYVFWLKCTRRYSLFNNSFMEKASSQRLVIITLSTQSL